jgi:hypothetical protein
MIEKIIGLLRCFTAAAEAGLGIGRVGAVIDAARLEIPRLMKIL